MGAVVSFVKKHLVITADTPEGNQAYVRCTAIAFYIRQYMCSADFAKSFVTRTADHVYAAAAASAPSDAMKLMRCVEDAAEASALPDESLRHKVETIRNDFARACNKPAPSGDEEHNVRQQAPQVDGEGDTDQDRDDPESPVRQRCDDWPSQPALWLSRMPFVSRVVSDWF
jgi:hypothetical protein